jgi:hypothetical protein
VAEVEGVVSGAGLVVELVDGLELDDSVGFAGIFYDWVFESLEEAIFCD